MRILIGILMVASATAGACNFNSDCQTGSVCVRRSVGFGGICLGGMNQGNESDSAPSQIQTYGGQTVGNQCTSALDCDFGQRCLKSGYSYNGVCQ